MAQITNRDSFIEYCLRKLGAPVIEINVDDDQIQDRVDDAIQYWQDYHYDGMQKIYYIHHIDQTDVNNKFISLDPDNTPDAQNNRMEIIGVSRIFPLMDSQATISMFDLRYQLRLNELYDFTSASYINYTLTQQHLRSLEIMFTGETPIRYSRHQKRLYIEWAWGMSQCPVGTVVVAECYAAFNPDVYSDIWNDRWLKKYATALIKRAWGNNMKKFKDVPLLGGITMNGQEIYQEAVDEIHELEESMEKNLSAPLEWFMN